MTGIAIIGCGKQAEKHLKSLRKLQDINITVADQNPAQAEALAHIYGVCVASVDEVLKNPSLQGVVICTPTLAHTALILQAFSYGKDVFCEKPLCTTIGEAQLIVEKSSDSGRYGLVGYVYRYSPVFRFIHEILQKPSNISPLGHPVMATMRIGGRGSHQLWKHCRSSDGGAINEMFVHMLDLALWLFGDVADAKLIRKSLLRPIREIQGTPHEVDAEDFVLAELVMKSGMHIYIQADLLTPGFSQHIEIQGDQGSFIGAIQPEIPARLFCSRPIGSYKEGWNPLNIPFVNLLDEQMNHFVRLIERKDIIPYVSVNDSLKLKQVMELFYNE